MPEELTVREAILEDLVVIWEWWNDSVTREMMRQNDYVPLEEHTKWFEAVLKDHDKTLCVGLVGSEKIGVVRFDRQVENVYEASINLSPLHRGVGYAPRILRASIDYLRTIQSPKLIFATVKKINIPSERSFLRAGFKFVSNPPRHYAGLFDFDAETKNYFEMIIEDTE